MKTKFTLIISLISFYVNAQWSAVNNGLGSLQIRGIGVSQNTVIAVTVDQGMFISTDNGDNWQPHPNNSQLPNFNILYAEGDPLGFAGLTILGQGFFAGVTNNSAYAIPIVGIPNNNLTCWFSESGAGISDAEIFGTAGGGVFWANNMSSTSWTSIPGLPSGDAQYITGLFVESDSNDDEFLIVGTKNGAYISGANSLQSLSPFNNGLQGNSLIVNKLYGNFALTKEGLYRAGEDQPGGLQAGWMQMYPTGDFRAAVFDYLGQRFLFFGNNIGISFSQTGPTNVDLTGITGGAITSGTAFYPNFQPNGFLFVGTETGGVFRMAISATSVEQISDNIPNSFELYQNYPNPFNPSTKISFSIPNSEYVTLKVYDVLGKEIATLVSEQLDAGSYSYNFDASKLTSGIYFYKLQAGKFSETRKMILTK